MVEMKGLGEETPIQQMAIKDGFPPASNGNNNSSARRNAPSSKSDVIDSLCTSLNQDLLIAKTFYFFFFSAFGSLFPLLAVYFKQMGMNATQSGLLIGFRPFVEFLAAPFWGGMADRFRKGKIMLLCSLISWIVFTLALAFIQPPASSCVQFNETHHSRSIPEGQRDKRSISEDYALYLDEPDLLEQDDLISNLALREVKENDTHGSNTIANEGIVADHTRHTSGNDNEAENTKDTTSKNNEAENTQDTTSKNDEAENTQDTTGKNNEAEHTKETSGKNNEAEDTKETSVKNNEAEHTKETSGKNDEAEHTKETSGKNNGAEHTKETSGKNNEAEHTKDTTVKNNVPEHNTGDRATDTTTKSSLEGHTKEPKRRNKKKENEKSVEVDYYEDKSGQKLPPNYGVGKSPSSVEYTRNFNQDKHASYISPPFSSILYKWEDVQETFFLLMLLVVLGEFFSAPAITLADSATLSYLADNTDNYGKQRMFGSLGWGLAMFFVGIALDHSTAFPDHPCKPHERERNYTICFATFSVLMGCAFIAATQFTFDYSAIDDQIAMKSVAENGPSPSQKGTGLPSFLTEGTVIDDGPIPLPSPKKEQPAPKTTVFAQTTRKLPEWLTVLRTFANLRYGAFLYVTWFMGFGVGLVFTFLFWHLQDLGGTPTLFGVASVINHISEIFAYFFSFKFIRQIGHTKVLCVGLVGNICRFLYISWLRNPWWVLPFEFVQGITHAAVWAACCSYITQATPANLRSSAQGVLQGLHHGLGRGCGAVIGGIFVTHFGTQVTFRGYGFACLIVLILFICINYYRTDKGFSSFHDDQEPDTVMEETVHLAPHGVPSNPMARSLSKQNIDEQRSRTNNNNETGGGGGGGYGSADQTTTGGFLDVPNARGHCTGIVGGTSYVKDFNMNTTLPPGGSSGALTRRALAAAFNPKGILAQATSPETIFEYDFIRKDFKAYEEVTMMMMNNANGNVDSKSNILVGPMPETKEFNPQPQRYRDSHYEW